MLVVGVVTILFGRFMTWNYRHKYSFWGIYLVGVIALAIAVIAYIQERRSTDGRPFSKYEYETVLDYYVLPYALKNSQKIRFTDYHVQRCNDSLGYIRANGIYNDLKIVVFFRKAYQNRFSSSTVQGEERITEPWSKESLDNTETAFNHVGYCLEIDLSERLSQLFPGMSISGGGGWFLNEKFALKGIGAQGYIGDGTLHLNFDSSNDLFDPKALEFDIACKTIEGDVGKLADTIDKCVEIALNDLVKNV
jgi:hypothetical protein